MSYMPLTEGANSYAGFGIHVPPMVMDQFAVFCLGYAACSLNFAWLWICFEEICHSQGQIPEIYVYR